MTESTEKIALTALAKEQVAALISQQSRSYVYHNFRHTEEVVRAVRSLANDHGLNNHDKTLLEVAAWFHDADYGRGAEGHEERGAALARTFLQGQGADEQDILVVAKCILTTKIGGKPENLMEMIIRDADFSHVAGKGFLKRANLLRMEWELVDGMVFTDTEWLKKNISFLEHLKYHTTIARADWGKSQTEHLKKLGKQLKNLESDGAIDKSEATNAKDVRKYNRGVETMFRVTLRNHISLSRIADNKANFLLSISAIILSLLLGNLITDNKPVASMLMPSIYFLLVCIVTMVLAILATRPNITKGKFTKDALLSKQANILFFGNFHSMPQDDFEWGMKKLMEDDELLYHSLTTDLYFLGKVLHKKYQYLRLAFQAFMYGLISSALFYLTMLIVY